MWPDVSRAALQDELEDLADTVEHDQQLLLDQMLVGRGDPLELRIKVGYHGEAANAGSITLSDLEEDITAGTLPRRIVVVGEPGAGKTVVGIRLLLMWLRHRNALQSDGPRFKSPVPVRVEASGWDGNRDREFTKWLASQLTDRYRLHPRVAHALVDSGRILPILDGIDEMDSIGAPPERALAVLSQLNAPPWDRRPNVVVCSADTIAEIQSRSGHVGLHSATTFSVQPLTDADIKDHLEQFCGRVCIDPSQWSPVITQVARDPGGPLATALDNPLALSLAAAALSPHGGRVDPADLAALDQPAAIRSALFAALIPAAVSATPSVARARGYTQDSVQAWLTTLARHLQQQQNSGHGGSGITLDQVWKLAGLVKCAALHTVFAAALVAVAIGGLIILADDNKSAGQFGLIPVVLAALVSSYFAGSYLPATGLRPQVPGLRGTSERFAWRVPGCPRWRRGVRAGLVVFMALSLIMSVTVAIAWAVAPVPFHVLIPVLLFVFSAVGSLGLAAGLVVGLSTTVDERLTLGQTARRIIRDDIEFAVATGLLCGLAFGISAGLGVRALRPDSSIFASINDGMLGALLIGFVVWFVAGLTTTRHLAASLVFRLNRTFPARPARFLDWANNAGLLRVNGTAYEIRHRTYQEWLLDPTSHPPSGSQDR